MTQSEGPFVEPPGAGDPMLGRILAGRYEILRLIAEGGMGRVYEARQRALDRKVAIKCIHPYLLATEHMVVRFMDEARLASQLVHPNVVQIYDFGRAPPAEGGTLFIVMELLTGKNLSTVIADEAPFPLARTHAILRSILSALGEAHARGFTHRDAKPENVILEPLAARPAAARADGRGERVKLIDFGIAKVHGARGVTSVGQFIGTPHYMPPEQIRGEAAEVSADLYAAGVTLFQMLTGRLPFDAGSVTAVLEQQLYAPRPDPRDVAPEGACPAALAAVCLRALHVDRAARYATADAFVEALDLAVRQSQPPRRRRSTAPPPRPVATASTGMADSVDGGDERRRTVPPTSGVRGVSLEEGERIERAARAALASGRHDEAINLLEGGLALGAGAFRVGDAALGRAAILVFGRLLGEAFRATGRTAESAQAIREALPYAESDPLAKAKLLAELARTLAAEGLLLQAEAARVEALRLAADTSDQSLKADLRRLAQAVAPASRRAPLGAPPRTPAPAPRQSEWRFRRDSGDTRRGVPSRRQR